MKNVIRVWPSRCIDLQTRSGHNLTGMFDTNPVLRNRGNVERYLPNSLWTIKSFKLIARHPNYIRELNGFIRIKNPRSRYDDVHWLHKVRLFAFVFPVFIHDSMIAFPAYLLSLCYIVCDTLCDQG